MPWVSGPPSPEAKALIDNFNTFRGGYLNSFAQMEFSVGRILSRFDCTSPFEGSISHVRFRFEARLDALEEILQARCELEKFKEQGQKLCSNIRDTHQLRNYFAHGLVRLDLDSLTFTIRRILPEKGNPWREVELEIHANQIVPELSKMSLLCQEFMHFTRELSETFGLEF